MRARMSLKSQNGFSLISILVGTGIISIVAMGVVTWNLQKRKLSQHINVQAVADQITQKLKGAIISPESWAKTYSFSHANNPGNANQALDVFIVDGDDPSSSAVPYYRSSNNRVGFDMQGNPCRDFDAQNGNDACPFRYDITLVSHTFQNGNWIDKIRFALTYKPSDSKGAILNTSAASGKYNFEFTRNWDDHSVEKSCVSVSGTYDIATGKCTVKLTNPVSCNPGIGGTAYKGPNGGISLANCESPRAPATLCGSNMAITGFTQQGAPICVHL